MHASSLSARSLLRSWGNTANIGFSTAVYTDWRSDWASLLRAVHAQNPRVAELSALDASELPSLLAYLRTYPESLGAEYSIHAPSKSLPSSSLSSCLADLRFLSTKVKRLIIHPDIIGNALDDLHSLGDKIVLENLDARKTRGRDVPEMQSLFDKLPDARFCFDVAHAWSTDPTLSLAHSLLDTFGDRLVQVHLSGIDSAGHHCSLSVNQLNAYRPTLNRARHVPWIVESTLAR